jgi:hypothetical protein
MSKTYKAELTITPAMAEKSKGGVIYYFCHIHSKMSGKIIIQNADGTPYNSTTNELPLYPTMAISGVDRTCGCTGLETYNGGGADQCDDRFLCGSLDTNFEKCMQAIDCQMKSEMLSYTSADLSDKVAVFMQQMIPHHHNAVSMSKILLQMVPAADIDAAMEDNALTDILYNIISEQNYQIHQFRNYLGAAGLLPGESAGSCYNPQTHGVTCNVPESSCTGYYYAPGYVSSMSQCCHCKASCALLNSSCSYYDDPATTTVAAGAGVDSAEGTTVSGEFKVEGVDWNTLSNDETLKSAFKDKCAAQIASSAGNGISAEHVTVTLSEGSVKVAYVIAVPAGIEASSLEDNLAADNEAGTFLTELAAAITSISGIDTAITGSLGVSGFAVDEEEESPSDDASRCGICFLIALILAGLIGLHQ